MAKRFIDTNMFADEWFGNLSKDGKLFFVYYITTCDHAGILKVNKKLLEFQTGIKSLETVTKELGDCLITVKENVFFMPKFIKFQYPNFPKSTVKQQYGAINILKSFNLWDEENNTLLTENKDLPNSYQTLTKELTNSYVNGNDNVDNNNKEIPEFKEFLEYAKIQKPNVCESTLKLKYDSWVVNGWKSGNDKKIKNWKNTLNNTLPFIKESEVKPVYTGLSIADQIEKMRNA